MTPSSARPSIRHALGHRLPCCGLHITGLAAMASILALGACATAAPPSPTMRIAVTSNPAGALVSLVPEDATDSARLVVGVTPIEQVISLGSGGRTQLRIEKRGFAAETVAITPSVGATAVELKPTGGSTELPDDIASATAIALVGPRVEVIRRGFSKEAVSAEDSAAAAEAITRAIEETLAGGVTLRSVSSSTGSSGDLDAFVRDARAATTLVDPIRLPFLDEGPRLQSAAGRRVATEIGAATGTRPVLFISGRSSVETGGMKAGKLGLMVAGTAASYGAGYSQAMARGDSFFTYNVYLPQAGGGTRLDAILVDAATGEILWLNRGLYAPLDLDHPAAIGHIVADLLSGLPVGGPADNLKPRMSGSGE